MGDKDEPRKKAIFQQQQHPRGLQLADVYNAGAELLRLSELAAKHNPGAAASLTSLGIPASAVPLTPIAPGALTTSAAAITPISTKSPTGSGGGKLPAFGNTFAFSSSEPTQLVPSRPSTQSLSPPAAPQLVQSPYVIPFPMGANGQPQLFQPTYYVPVGFPYGHNMAMAAAASAHPAAFPQYPQAPHGFPMQIQMIPQMSMPGLPFPGFPATAPTANPSSSAINAATAAAAATLTAAAVTRPPNSQ